MMAPSSPLMSSAVTLGAAGVPPDTAAKMTEGLVYLKRSERSPRTLGGGAGGRVGARTGWG
jgi:hypothetical protein